MLGVVAAIIGIVRTAVYAACWLNTSADDDTFDVGTPTLTEAPGLRTESPVVPKTRSFTVKVNIMIGAVVHQLSSNFAGIPSDTTTPHSTPPTTSPLSLLSKLVAAKYAEESSRE
jgi:hypothetical protein